MIRITSSIVAYNNDFEIISKSISSFLNADIGEKKLYIIDNSTEDILKSKINHTFSDYQNDLFYYKMPKNLGFGRGHNKAWEKIKENHHLAHYHLILNPDVWFTSEVLKEMTTYMDKNQDVGMMSPKIVFPNGSCQFVHRKLPTPVDSLVRMFHKFLPGHFVKKINHSYELRHIDRSSAQEFPQLSGCFLLLKGKAFEDAGGFDKRFFLYFEDIDLSRRIGHKYKIIGFPKASITHIYSRHSYENPIVRFHHIISAIKYYTKWGWFFDKERKRINSPFQ